MLIDYHVVSNFSKISEGYSLSYELLIMKTNIIIVVDCTSVGSEGVAPDRKFMVCKIHKPQYANNKP